jgi:hypothetical protein
VGDTVSQPGDFSLERVDIVLGLLIGFGRPLNVMQEFWFVLLKLVVIKSNIRGCAGIDI